MMDEVSVSPKPKENTWAMLCHLVPILTCLSVAGVWLTWAFSIGAVFFVWFLKKDSDPEVNEHGRQSLNWQITILLALIVVVGGITGHHIWRLKVTSAELTKYDAIRMYGSTATEEEKIVAQKMRDKVFEEWKTLTPVAMKYNWKLWFMMIFGASVGVMDFIYTIWNSIRGFREQPANYPWTIPLFATRARRGLIR